MIRLIERFLYNAAYLFIYFAGGLLTVVALFAKVSSQEHQFFFVPQSHRANPAAHTIFSNHRACDLSHALNLVCRLLLEKKKNNHFAKMPSPSLCPHVLDFALASDMTHF